MPTAPSKPAAPLTPPQGACRRPRDASEDEPAPQQLHAFNHAPAALRIFRFAADSAPRVLELAHISAFLRECAVEFGSADAALPGALRCEYTARRYFMVLRSLQYRSWCCPWLAEKVLACRSGAPMPAAALAPDVTRHDVNWGAEGASCSNHLHLTYGGFGLSVATLAFAWAQGPVGVTSGKHYFHVHLISDFSFGMSAWVGWVDGKTSVGREHVGRKGTLWSGACYNSRTRASGSFWFGTAPLAADSFIDAPVNARSCTIGCLLDLDATPARMTVFVDGEPLEVQCEYEFPKDGRAWYPTVGTRSHMALHSCAI